MATYMCYAPKKMRCKCYSAEEINAITIKSVRRWAWSCSQRRWDCRSQPQGTTCVSACDSAHPGPLRLSNVSTIGNRCFPSLQPCHNVVELFQPIHMEEEERYARTDELPSPPDLQNSFILTRTTTFAFGKFSTVYHWRVAGLQSGNAAVSRG